MSQPATLEDIKSYIESIDFSMIIEKMIGVDGWLKKDALKTCQLYRNFLFLKIKYSKEGVNLPPSLDVDEFWHYHILDSEKYRKDCLAIFGDYLHHYPYFGIDSTTNMDDLNSAFQAVQNLHFKEFGEYIVLTRKARNPLINYIMSRLEFLVGAK